MSNVSQGAGLSQGIVNFHFKTKELLLIETLKFISNEYLASFQKRLQKAGDDPQKQIISIIDHDFDKKICNRDKIAVWYTFLGEAKFKPVYMQICKERDEYYSGTIFSIFSILINKEKNTNLSAKKLTSCLLALTMGLWLDQLVDSENFIRQEAREICVDFVIKNFPKQFKGLS
ncbi:MAG: HTH-type transcriptional regulator BetI [Alphaproteobacteria bacterium MarineAlpha5_Bin10]|nr:MAG: HTH-type transcriptional regulator BetI [Alphaproteobacteria bacterium MarineAlpha5_Bin10]